MKKEVISQMVELVKQSIYEKDSKLRANARIINKLSEESAALKRLKAEETLLLRKISGKKVSK